MIGRFENVNEEESIGVNVNRTRRDESGVSTARRTEKGERRTERDGIEASAR